MSNPDGRRPEQAISGSERRKNLDPETQEKLRRYIALMEKWNRTAGGTPAFLSDGETRELGRLRADLGDELIRNYVDAFEVNGRVFPE